MTTLSADEFAAQLRQIPATELRTGDQVFRPDLGTAYHVAEDGSVRSGMGWAELDGTVFAVDAVTEGALTASRDDQAQQNYTVEPYHRVLRFTR